jgi:hypothetical protein
MRRVAAWDGDLGHDSAAMRKWEDEDSDDWK